MGDFLGVSLVVIGCVCIALSLRMVVAPTGFLEDMVKKEEHATWCKGNVVVEVIVRWAGVFFLGLACTTCWMGMQDARDVAVLHLLHGMVWVVDAVVIKFWHFANSGAVKWKDAQGAGTLDFAVGSLHIIRGAQALFSSIG